MWLSHSISTGWTTPIRSRSTDKPPTCQNDPFGIDDIHEIWNSDPLFYPANHQRTG